MNLLQLLSLGAGICFGLWPLFINRSGLQGIAASVLLNAVSAIIILPFAWKQLHGLEKTHWSMFGVAAAAGAVGMLFFNQMLAKASPSQVSSLFVLMILAQTAIAAIYQAIQDGMSWHKLAGFAFAAVAVYFLNK